MTKELLVVELIHIAQYECLAMYSTHENKQIIKTYYDSTHPNYLNDFNEQKTLTNYNELIKLIKTNKQTLYCVLNNTKYNHLYKYIAEKDKFIKCCINKN